MRFVNVCNFSKGKFETMNEMQKAMYNLSLRNSSRNFFSGNKDMHKYLVNVNQVVYNKNIYKIMLNNMI